MEGLRSNLGNPASRQRSLQCLHGALSARIGLTESASLYAWPLVSRWASFFQGRPGDYLVRGSEPFETKEVSLGASVAGYFVGFLAAGVVGGLLNPLARTRSGAVVLGVLCTLPLAFTALLLLEGTPIPPDGADVFAVLFLSLGFGGPLGLMACKEFVAKRPLWSISSPTLATIIFGLGLLTAA